MKQAACIARIKQRLILHRQALLWLLAVLFCLLLCCLPLRSARLIVPYPLASVAAADPYAQQADAFLKGQIALDVTPSAELLALDNPYEPSERQGVSFLWDRALYEGRYYSYFGTAPVLTVYLPICLLFGVMPTATLASLLLGMLATVLLWLALRELLCRAGQASGSVLSVACGIALFFAAVYPALCFADFYYVAVLSATAYGSGFVFLMLRGLRASGQGSRTVLLSLSALCGVLCVWSRPTAALMCLTAAPFLVCFAWHACRERAYARLLSLCPLVLILCAGAGLTLLYNAVRFGSPLSFGAEYQLTVSDIARNRLDIRYLPDALRAYFVQAPVRVEGSLWPDRQFISYSTAHRYVYAEATVGAFCFGLPLALPAAAHPAVRRDCPLLWAVLLGVVLSVAVAFADFCLAGVNLRYLNDILPTLCLLGTAVAVPAVTGARTRRTRLLLSVPLYLLCLMAAVMAIGIDVHF